MKKNEAIYNITEIQLQIKVKENVTIQRQKERRHQRNYRECDRSKYDNLSNAVFSEDQKTLLKKGSSFIPTRAGINWYDVPKDLTKFVNKIRQFSDVSDQPVQ